MGTSTGIAIACLFIALTAAFIVAWRFRDQPLEFDFAETLTNPAFLLAEPTVAKLAKAGEQPPQFTPPKDKLVNQQYFNDSSEFGHFGEMLTAVLVANEGWYQIPSHTGGGSALGLDHIFIKEVTTGRYEVLLIETKITGSSNENYDEKEMSDVEVKRRLGDWSELDESHRQMATEIIAAIDRRSQYVKKELWLHDSRQFTLQVFRLGTGGEKIRPMRKTIAYDGPERLQYKRMALSVAISMKTYYRNSKLSPSEISKTEATGP
jgi:hypothetical protein